MLDLAELSRHTLSATSKGIPQILDGVTIEDAPKRGLNLLRDPFPAPVAVLRESALRANIELMRQYTRSAGVELAPHGKTTMAAQLFDLQLEAGAWGITCATAAHLRVYRRFGVPRIVMANQLLDTDSVQFVAGGGALGHGFAPPPVTLGSSFTGSSIRSRARANTTMSCRTCRVAAH
jgi:D-serine dehydratase